MHHSGSHRRELDRALVYGLHQKIAIGHVNVRVQGGVEAVIDSYELFLERSDDVGDVVLGAEGEYELQYLFLDWILPHLREMRICVN